MVWLLIESGVEVKKVPIVRDGVVLSSKNVVSVVVELNSPTVVQEAVFHL